MKVSRKKALQSLVTGFVAVPSLSQANTNAELSRFKEEFSEAWKSSKKYTLTIYNQMPEEKMEFKYTPESFSWRTQFVHCIVFTTAQLCGRLNILNPNESKEKKQGYWKTLTKTELEQELIGFYDWVEKVVTETHTEKLLQMENYAGGQIPIWRLFCALENHIIHHRGQAICYLRLNGVTPEGYIGW